MGFEEGCLSVCDTGLDLEWRLGQGAPCWGWVGVGRVRNRATSEGRNPSQDRPPCSVYNVDVQYVCESMRKIMSVMFVCIKKKVKTVNRELNY